MAHIKPLIKGWDQCVYLACGSDKRVPAKLSIGFDSRGYIGWEDFVKKYNLTAGAQCLFKFDKIGYCITIAVYML
uniref:TF-B3 domain-containing protein n=1 Tax=Arundo donax TaxID=35708 RepID=A0A0A9EUT7_ARUDO